MGERSWWTRLLCFVFGHEWSDAGDSSVAGWQVRHCERGTCGAAEVRKRGGEWHVPRYP